MPKLLVTGAGGMVGRNILEHPSIANWQVLSPRRDELDLTGYASTEAYLRTHMPDVIVHAAGLVGGIQANIARPVDFLTINLEIGRNIITAARAVGVPRLLNLASSCMYPRDGENPLQEDLILSGPLEPTNEGYALAKIISTRLCQYIRRETESFQYKTLIPCNLYGKYDKFAPEHSHLIPAIIHKVHEAKARGLNEVEVWGDGTTRREFMYAGDLADAVLRAAEDVDSLPDIMNVGIGHDHTVNDYYDAVKKVIDWQGCFVHDLSKPVGMKRKVVNIERQTAWGWSPATSLEEGLRLTYRYYLEKVVA